MRQPYFCQPEIEQATFTFLLSLMDEQKPRASPLAELATWIMRRVVSQKPSSFFVARQEVQGWNLIEDAPQRRVRHQLRIRSIEWARIGEGERRDKN